MGELEADVIRRCDKCGSGNHQSFDCSKVYNGWLEREAEAPVARPDVLPAISVQPAEENAPKAVTKPTKPDFDSPRWPGGPKICTKTNLLAFRDGKEVDAFQKTNLPGMSEIKRVTCSCGMIHASWVSDHARVPAGKMQSRAGFPFLRDCTRKEMDQRSRSVPILKQGENDLPKVDRTLPIALPKAEQQTAKQKTKTKLPVKIEDNQKLLW